MVVPKYQKRISGLLWDRIDIHIEMPRARYEKLSSERIEAARDRQPAWFGAAGRVHVESATYLMSNADFGGVKRSSLRIL